VAGFDEVCDEALFEYKARMVRTDGNSHSTEV
jgi:hypothetical protein